MLFSSVDVRKLLVANNFSCFASCYSHRSSTQQVSLLHKLFLQFHIRNIGIAFGCYLTHKCNYDLRLDFCKRFKNSDRDLHIPFVACTRYCLVEFMQRNYHTIGNTVQSIYFRPFRFSIFLSELF